MSALPDELLAAHGGADRWRECSCLARKAAAGKQATVKVSDGTRTRDRLDHNQELYQLSYAHQARRSVALSSGAGR